jgi:uncharacterized protein YndB with AHSA1/START domain
MRPAGLTLELTREFPVPRARLFELFADAALLATWWGPRGFRIPGIDFRPRAGATYRIGMQPPEGEAFELTGTFRQVEPPSLLAFSFEWVPADPDDQETLVRLSFQAVGESTRVQLEQGPFKTEARRALHRDGWTESFDKLAGCASRHPGALGER